VGRVEKKLKVWSNSHTDFLLHCPRMSWTKYLNLVGKRNRQQTKLCARSYFATLCS